MPQFCRHGLLVVVFSSYNLRICQPLEKKTCLMSINIFPSN